MSGAGSSSRSRKHHDTGEFTDDEDYGIPLEDIREAEFDRLEHTSVAGGTDKSGGVTRSLSSWLPWLSKRQQKGSLGDYAQLDEDEGLPISRRRTTIAATPRWDGEYCTLITPCLVPGAPLTNATPVFSCSSPVCVSWLQLQ